MKKLVYCLFASLALLSCGGGNYSITATLPDKESNGKTAFLINYDTKDTIDSVKVKENIIHFRGKVESPNLVRLTLNGAPKGTFILEKGEITLNVKEKRATGTDLNDALNDLNKQDQALEQEFKSKQDKLSPEELKAAISDMHKKEEKLYRDAYEDNKHNPIGYYAFLQFTYDYSSQKLDSILEDAPSSLKEMKRIIAWVKSAKTKEMSAEGSKFIDFTIKSEDGMETRLSDFVGKGDYVLVDFWASWCGPCVKELSVIKEIYNKYNDQGLQILGVAVWDEPERTRESITMNNIIWPQIINAQSIPTEAYGITGIPHIIIFSPDGTILSRGLQGESLKAKVDEIMDK
ncbi:MAG: TlpA disulfide reductase family protein [Muribaculaceae bacterium]|nr:TlpA disulfide reductase family protein [Muribaculaceae bacterium]